MKNTVEATALPGFVEVSAVSQGTSPASVFSLFLWSFSLQGNNDYVTQEEISKDQHFKYKLVLM